MNGRPSSVGAAIAAALDRAEELRRLSDRPPRVRIMTIFGDDRSGLTINARIAARTPAESWAQEGLGTRCIPWDELDQRADELVSLVDATVGEVTLAVRNAPASLRPSRSESDGDLGVFEALVDELGRSLTQTALAVLRDPRARSASRRLGSEATMVAALKLAALAAFTANIGANEAQEELALAIGDVLSRSSVEVQKLGEQPLN
jgi:hypothetical protein